MSEEMKTGVVDSVGNLSIDEAASRAIDEVTESSPAEESVDKEMGARSEKEEVREASVDAPNKAAEEVAIEWDKLPPQAKKAYEAEKLRAAELNKNYENLRSLTNKQITELQKKEKSFEGHLTKAQQFDRLDQLYRSNPAIKQAIDEALGVSKKVDPILEADPVYKYIRDMEQKFEQRLNPLIQDRQTEAQAREERQLNDRVEKLTDQAKAEYKTFFGKDPSPEEITKVYQTMTDREIYDGAAAVRAAFMDEIVNARIQEKLAEQSSKKTKSGKTTSINPSRAVQSGKVKSYKEAAELAWEELGIQI